MTKAPGKGRALAAAVLASLLLALLMAGTAAQGGTIEQDTACSGSQVTIDPGTTTVLAHGTTRFTASQVTDSLGGGRLTWDLRGEVFGPNTFPEQEGDLAGHLDFTIDWNQSRPNTVFHSDCVGLVRTQFKIIDGSYEGTFSGYPLNDNTNTATTQGGTSTSPPPPSGTAAIHLQRVTAKVANLDLEVDRGTTCDAQEPGFEIHRPEAQALGEKTGNAGRALVCNKG